MLMRMALGSKTVASTAVLYALLGFSSLSRYGYNEQALQLKIFSLHALVKAAETKMDHVDGTRHIAAGMLLCSIEVHQSSWSASEWTWYLNGIKTLTHSNNAHLNCKLDDEESNMLLNWVYYHDVMKRFSIRHWGFGPKDTSRRSRAVPEVRSGNTAREEVPSEYFVKCQKLLKPEPWVAATLKLMSEICDAVPTKPCLKFLKAEQLKYHINLIKILDWKIRNIPIPSPGEKDVDQGKKTWIRPKSHASTSSPCLFTSIESPEIYSTRVPRYASIFTTLLLSCPS
ncbi:hypothetical protein BU23DRAFT_642362 [Bimuria novae-zelandiae CBS 107.79]|uniref:Transcription factor domain-containing protein n=1 Tax=Bimuria novae-zelandiae CBS 107.79 TaxID=1447943 RepID=A0A6A5VTZ0_9PLEO|nr:hypothetical protein BU23DRAFT_642362 [Bimuria novae-zelandiae CBS 107.79]